MLSAGYRVTDWQRIINTKRKVDIMRKFKGNMLANETESPVNAFGIHSDPATAAKAIEDGSLKVTEDVDNVDGNIVETFSITVKGKETDAEGVESDKVFYQAEKQPFGWTRTSNLPGVFASLGAEMTDDQISFIGQALSGEKQGEAVLHLIELFNADERNKAKANEYARIMNLYKPASEEDKAKAKENMVKNYAKAYQVSMEAAREALRKMGIA